MDLLTKDNIEFIIYIIGLLFIAYNTFRKPQIRADKDISIMGGKIDNLKKEMADLKDNHLHSIEEKQDELKDDIGEMNTKITQLATIIEERTEKRIN